MTATEHEAVSGTRDRRRWIGLGVLATGLSMVVIDGTIVGVALPTIIGALNLDLTQAQWVNSLYAVVFAGLLLSAGRLADRIGRRRLFLAGLVLFALGSILASGAGAFPQLLWGRVVQGVGGALILPASLSTVNAVFRGRDRAVAFGVWGAVISGAAAVGPLLGGWLTTFSWPWIFWVNVPIAVVAIAGTLWAVPETRGARGGKGLDVDGLLLSAIGFGLLVFAIIEGPTLGWWMPATDFTLFGLTWGTGMPISIVPVSAAIGAVALVLFVLWERHRARVRRSAILELSLFRLPTFTWGNLTAGMVAIGEFAIVFVLPLFLINALGLNSMGAGLVLAAMALGAFVAGASARHLAARFGPPTVVLIGLGLEVIGILAVAITLSPDVSPWLIAVLLVIYGVGLGLASAQLTSTVLSDVPVEFSGQGSSAQSTVRQVGAAIGAAVAGATLSVVLAISLPAALDSLNLPTGAAQLAESTRQSAGSSITALRQQGGSSAFGDQTGEVVHALSSGFGVGTRFALFAAAVFLLVGFFSALRVRFVAGKQRSQR